MADDDAQRWHQLAQRHHRAIIQLRQQAASWGEQVAELKSQLREIRALHQAIQVRQRSHQSVSGVAGESASGPLLGFGESIEMQTILPVTNDRS